jgi:NTE family protein
MIIPPYRVTLSGGGIRGLAHIGTLEVLEERGALRAVREYLGISAGALIAFCMCVGTTLSELRMMATLLDFGKIRDLEPETMLSFMETFGLDTGANLEKLARAILRAKGLSPTLTFEELVVARPSLPRLRIFATDLNTCTICELSATTSPTMELAMALRASTCIPVYFQPVLHPVTGHYLVDGGVVSHSPFMFLTPEEADTTLSITFSDEHKPVGSIGDLKDFLVQLYYAFDFYFNKELTEKRRGQVLFIQTGRMNSLDFELTQDQKIELMNMGRSSAENFLRAFPGLRKQTMVRRFSVA